MEDPREDVRENRKVGETKDSAGHKSCRWKVACVDEEVADSRKSGGDNLGEVWIVGNVEESKERHTHAPCGRPGCRSTYWASQDRRDEPCEIREVVCDEFREMCGEQRASLTIIILLES